MSDIKSPIGNVHINSKNKLPTFKVEDPRMPISPPTTSSEPKQISVQDYNNYKKQIEEMSFNARSSIDVEEGLRNKEPLSQQDEQLLNMLQGQQPINKENLYELRSKAKQQKMSISPENKEKIGILLGLGRKTTTVIIDDSEIVLQNLTSNQTKKVLNAVYEANLIQKQNGIQNFDQVYLTKHMVVGFALKSINGQLISDLLGNDDTDEMRQAIVEEMDSIVIDKLYDEYTNKIGKQLKLNNDLGEEIKK